MAKKKAKAKRGLITQPEVKGGLTMDQVVSHPAFVEVARQLQDVKSMLSTLPEAIGRAVAAANHSASLPASGPRQKMLEPKEVEFGPRMVTLDGKQYALPPVKPKDKNGKGKEIPAGKTEVNPG